MSDPTDPLPNPAPLSPPPGDLAAAPQPLTTAADLGSAQPAPPLVAVPLPGTPAFPPDRASRSAGYGGDALIALGVAVLFFFLGSPVFSWAANGFVGNPYGYVWPDDDPRAGQAVPMFQTQYGTAWRDVGLFATGVALLAEAALLGLTVVRPKLARPVLGAVLAVGLIGIAANVLAAVMQIRAGFSQPLYAVIGAIVCLFSCVTAFQRRRDLGA